MGIAAPPSCSTSSPQGDLYPRHGFNHNWHTCTPIQAPQPSDRPSNPTPYVSYSTDCCEAPGPCLRTGAQGGCVLSASSAPSPWMTAPTTAELTLARSRHGPMGSTCASNTRNTWGAKAVGSSARGPVGSHRAATPGQTHTHADGHEVSEGHEVAQVVKVVVAEEELGGPQKRRPVLRPRWVLGVTHSETHGASLGRRGPGAPNPLLLGLSLPTLPATQTLRPGSLSNGVSFMHKDDGHSRLTPRDRGNNPGH